MARPAHPLTLPEGATAEQWEAAFRAVERSFARNRNRHWVLNCLADRLRQQVAGLG